MSDSAASPRPADERLEPAEVLEVADVPEERPFGALLTDGQLWVLHRALALEGGLTIQRVSRGPSTASDVLFEAARRAPATLLDPPFAPGWDTPGAPTQERRLERLDAGGAHAGARALVRSALGYRSALRYADPQAWTPLDEALLLAELDARTDDGAVRHNLRQLLELLRGVEQHNALVRVARIVRDYDDRRPERERGRYLKFLSRGRNAGHAAELVVDALVNQPGASILPPAMELAPPSIADDLDGKVDHWLQVRDEPTALPLVALDTKIGATKGSTLMAQSRTHLYEDEDAHAYGRNVLRIDARISERFIASWILHAARGAPFSPEACYALCHAELCACGLRGKHLVPYETFRQRTQLAIGVAVRREIQHLLSTPQPL